MNWPPIRELTISFWQGFRDRLCGLDLPPSHPKHLMYYLRGQCEASNPKYGASMVGFAEKELGEAIKQAGKGRYAA